jgi:hypothetical protein
VSVNSDNPDAEPPEPPVMPTADEAAAEAPAPDERPVPVRYAFVVWVLAGIFAIVNAVDLLIDKQALIDAWIKTKDPNITDEQVASGVNTLLWMLLVAAVVFAVLFALFAYKAQDAVRRARLLLTVLCVLTVLFYFLILPTQFGLMTALLSLAATVLMYLPSSNRFYRPRQLPT